MGLRPLDITEHIDIDVYTCSDCDGTALTISTPAGWEEERAANYEGGKERPTGDWYCPYCRIERERVGNNL